MVKVHQCITDAVWVLLDISCFLVMLNRKVDVGILCRVGGYCMLFAVQELYCTVAAQGFLVLAWQRTNLSLAFRSIYVNLYVLVIITGLVTIATLTFLPLSNLEFFSSELPFTIACIPLRLPSEPSWEYSTLLITFMWLGDIVALALVIVIYWRIYRSSSKPGYKYRRQTLKTLHLSFGIDTIAATTVTVTLTVAYGATGIAGSTAAQLIVTGIITLAALVHSGVGWALHLGLPHTHCCTPEIIYSDNIKSNVPKSLNSLSRLQLSPKAEEVLKVRVQWQNEQGRRLEGVMKIYQPNKRQNWSREVKAMSKLSLMEHPNIATYLWAVNKNNFCGALEMVTGRGISQHSRVICRQYYEHGSLRDFLQDHIGRLTEASLHLITLDLANALAHLRELNILHNNLNSGCVFVAGSLESLTVKAVIGDFEASKEAQAQVPKLPKQRKDAVAVLYSISRYIDSLSSLEQNLYAPDVRSFGLILLEMLASLAYFRHGVKPNRTDPKNTIDISDDRPHRDNDGNLYERTPSKRTSPEARVIDQVRSSDIPKSSPIPDVISSCHSPVTKSSKDIGSVKSLSRNSSSQNSSHVMSRSRHAYSQKSASSLPRSYSPSPSRMSSASALSGAKKRLLPKPPYQPSIIPPSHLSTGDLATTDKLPPDSPDAYTILGPPLNNNILSPPSCFKDGRSHQKRRLPDTPNTRSVIKAWDFSCDNESLAGMMNHKPLISTTPTSSKMKHLFNYTKSFTSPPLDLTPYKRQNASSEIQRIGATSMQSRALPPIPIGMDSFAKKCEQPKLRSSKDLINHKSDMVGHINKSFVPDSEQSMSETEQKVMAKNKTPSKLKNVARNRDPVYSGARHDHSCSDDSFSLLNSFVAKNVKGADTSPASDDSGLGASSQANTNMPMKLNNPTHTGITDHNINIDNVDSERVEEYESFTNAMPKRESKIDSRNRTRNNESFDSTKCDTIYETITPAPIHRDATCTFDESDFNNEEISKIDDKTHRSKEDETLIESTAIIASTPHKNTKTGGSVANSTVSDHSNAFDMTQNTSVWSPGSSDWTPNISQVNETLELTCVSPRNDTPLSGIYEPIAGSVTPFTEISTLAVEETPSSSYQCQDKHRDSSIMEKTKHSPGEQKQKTPNEMRALNGETANETFVDNNDDPLQLTEACGSRVGVSRKLQFRKRSARSYSQNDLNKSLLEALGLIQKASTEEHMNLIFDDSALLDDADDMDIVLDFDDEDLENKKLNKSLEIALGLKTPGTPAKSSNENTDKTDLNKSFELAIGLRTPGTEEKPLVQNYRHSLFQPYNTRSTENAYLRNGGPSATKGKRSKRRLLPDLNAIVQDDTPDDIKRTINLHRTRYREMAVDSYFMNDPSMDSQMFDNLSGIISQTDASTVNSLIIDTDIMIRRILTPDDSLSMFSMKSTCVDSVTNYDATITPIKTDNVGAIAAKRTPLQTVSTTLKSIHEKLEPTPPERPPKPPKRRNMFVLPLQVQNDLAQTSLREIAVGIKDYHQVYCERLHHMFPLLDTRALLSRDTGHLNIIIQLLKTHGKLGFIGNQISVMIVECWTSDLAPSARDILNKLRRTLPSSPV